MFLYPKELKGKVDCFMSKLTGINNLGELQNRRAIKARSKDNSRELNAPTQFLKQFSTYRKKTDSAN